MSTALDPAPGQRLAYRFYNLLDARYITDLPLTGVTFGQRLNAAGTFKSTLPLGDQRVFNLSPITATQPGRTLVIIDLDGQIIWGGILWTRSYQQSRRTLELGGQEAWSYFAHRVQAQDYTNTWNTTYTDAMVIARQVILDALAVTGSAFRNMTVNLVYNSPSTPGNYITASFPITSLQTVDTIISDLAGMGYGVGFDFVITWAYVGEVPTPTLTLSYPFAGASYTSSSPLLDVAGLGGTNYLYPEDASQQANKMYVTANLLDTSGASVTDWTQAQDTDSLAAGYPLLEAVANFPQINSTAQMYAMCQGELATYQDPLVSPTVDASPFGPVPLGGFNIGDQVRLLVPAQVDIDAYADERFPGGAIP